MSTTSEFPEHATVIEHATRGERVGNQELHLYHRWSCSCGEAGSWGHALWARLSIESVQRSALRHVSHARQDAA